MDEIHQFITKQPCYEQHVIEIKRIYESRLFSILIPNILEGFRSLYNIAEKFEQKFEESVKNNPNVERMSVLVIFQKLISNIPNLTNHKIKGETDRIKTASRSADIFDELVKAVIKSNIILMTYNVDYKRKDLIQTRYHESVIVHDFVHSCYIEAARVFHNRPELFWTGYDSIIINQNKKICYEVIENSIRESINLALPMKEILSEYLNNPYEMKDDIRIYVIGEPKQDTKLDLENINLQKYPGNLPNKQVLISKGGSLLEGDEEFINAQELIDRDLGVYIGQNNGVNSLLESESESESDNNAFEPGGRSRLSVLLGSDSDITRGSKDSTAVESLLEEDEIPHLTPVDPKLIVGESIQNGNKTENNNASDVSRDSAKSNASNLVVDGIKTISLKTSLSGRGQAKSFFDEILPEANKKAEAHRKKPKVNDFDGSEFKTPAEFKTPIEIKSPVKNIIDSKNKSEFKSVDKDSDKSDGSDKSGIRITRTTETKNRDSTKDNNSNNREPIKNIVTRNTKSEEVTTEGVEEILDGILGGKKK